MTAGQHLHDEEVHRSRSDRIVHRVRHLLAPHHHDHGELAADQAFNGSELGVRTVRLALVALGITSIVQLVIVAASGSVALLADTAHNIGDATNSIPLLIAFSLGRRAATKRFTYGYGRAEDVAGIIIVLSILVSAGIVLWESSRRLVDPQSVQHLPWVAAAAIVGFVGNEAVAMLQIGVGRRIGSEALISDGLHARTDGLTSLAVLVAAGGAWMGMPLADPVIGLVIGVVILAIGWDAAKRIWGRLMDSVDPQLTESVRQALADRPDVRSVDQVRLRYVGHRLHGDVRIQVTDPTRATAVVADVRQSLSGEVPELADLVVEAG